jgi:hypothetical protein
LLLLTGLQPHQINKSEYLQSKTEITLQACVGWVAWCEAATDVLAEGASGWLRLYQFPFGAAITHTP